MAHKWHPMDLPAARQLASLTSTSVFPVMFSTNALPLSLQGIQGATSYVASVYQSPVQVAGVSVGGEFVVVRNDRSTDKKYNFAFGTSTNGQACFYGPEKRFAAHHSPTSAPAPISEAFGHVLSSYATTTGGTH